MRTVLTEAKPTKYPTTIAGAFDNVNRKSDGSLTYIAKTKDVFLPHNSTTSTIFYYFGNIALDKPVLLINSHDIDCPKRDIISAPFYSDLMLKSINIGQNTFLFMIIAHDKAPFLNTTCYW